MTVTTKIEEFRTRELERAEGALAAARDHLATTEERYRSGERVEDRSRFGAFVVTQNDVGRAQQRVAAAERVVDAWRTLLEQGTPETRLRAITPIQFGRDIAPGEVFDVGDEDLASIVQLIEVGAAAVAAPEPGPSDAAQLGSSELRKRLAIIDERRQRARERLAESEAELAAAQRELRDLEVGRELDGAKVAPAAIARAEARVSECERSCRARRAALEVETEHTEPDRVSYAAALEEAIAAEVAAALQARVDALYGRVFAARRRTLETAVAFENAIADERDLVTEMNAARAELSRSTGAIRIGELRVVEPDGGVGSRRMSDVIEQLAADATTKRAGITVRERVIDGRVRGEVTEIAST
jgi:hypothetical protein